MASLKSRLLSQLPVLDHGFLAPGEEPPSGFLRLHQVHSALVVGAEEQGCKADGIMTSGTEAVAVQTADCLPVLFSDRGGKTVAAVHAGWRGLNSGILVRAVERFAEGGVPASRLVVAIGPAIGRCCFEVSRDVIDEFEKNWSRLWTKCDRPWFDGRPASAVPARSQAPLSANNLWVDLDRIAELQLIDAGIPATSIEQVGHCTYCGPGQLASYRRGTHEGVKASRQWSWISK